MAPRPRHLLRPARGLLLAFVLLLVVGCGSSRPNCTDIVLRAVPNKGQQITAGDMKTAQEIIERRVTKLGVSSPTVTVHGDEIVIEGEGVHHPADVANIAATPGDLQIFDFEPSLAPPSLAGSRQPAPLPSLYGLLAAAKGQADRGSPQAYYLFRTKNHQVVQGPGAAREELLSPYKGRQPARTVILKVPANTEPVECRVAAGCPGAGSNGTSASGPHWYLFKDPPALTGEDLVRSGSAADVDPNTGQSIVTISFTGQGSKAFQRITKAEYDRGRVDAGLAGQLDARNPGTINRYAGRNAIVLDGQLEETPFIDYTDPALSDGIAGNAQIAEPNRQAAERTALVLRTGSLPFRFEQIRLSGCDL